MHPEVEATCVTQRPALLVLPPGRGGVSGAVGAGHPLPAHHRGHSEHDGLLRGPDTVGRGRRGEEAGVKIHQ